MTELHSVRRLQHLLQLLEGVTELPDSGVVEEGGHGNVKLSTDFGDLGAPADLRAPRDLWAPPKRRAADLRAKSGPCTLLAVSSARPPFTLPTSVNVNETPSHTFRSEDHLIQDGIVQDFPILQTWVNSFINL